MRVVWILGSGFSKPLGGPLLADLFSPQLYQHVLAALKARALSEDELFEIQRWYESKRSEFFGRVSASRPWTNAEEFLAMLERAAMPGSSSELLRLAADAAEVDSDIDAARMRTDERAAIARRYLAVACHHFVPASADAFDALEAGRPYRHWSKQLTSEDVVISFNYDLVVERTRDDLGQLPPLQVGLPDDSGSLSAGSGPLLLKLHGSVSFQETVRDSGRYVLDENVYEGVRIGRRMLMGVPGPSKLDLTNRLAPLWSAAEHALEQADVVVLVGYRFAETDDEAKRRLLGALSRNRQPKLTVRIVLGHGTPGDPGGRVRGLFEWALRQRGVTAPGARSTGRNGIMSATVDVVPMFAQDFLALADRQYLQ